jgi:uncharacterized protein YbjT (DUF2867 family)
MITVTGATGKTGSLTAELLLSKGEKIRVLGRSAQRLQGLAAKGAQVMAGDQSDVQFLTKAFLGADAVYLLIPPKMDAENVRNNYALMGDAAITALRKSNTPKVIFLSSLGAEKNEGTGPVVGLHDTERKLEKLNKTDLVFLRAGYFMENLLTGLTTLKKQNVFGNTMEPDAQVLMVAVKDIAAEAAKLLLDKNRNGHGIVDVFSDRISFSEMARVIGVAIGKPDLKYMRFPDNDAVAGMTAMGLSGDLARSFVDLSHAVNGGLITTTMGNPEKPIGATRFAQFVHEVLLPAYAAI